MNALAKPLHARRRIGQAGFSLLEVLIAVGVMTMIATLIFTAFSSLERSRNGIRRVSDRYREGRMALARISQELQGAYLSKHVPLNLNIATSKTVFIGEPGAPADRVDFNAFIYRRMDRDSATSDQAEVSYYGLEDPRQQGVTDLVRRINPKLDLEPAQGGVAQVLARDIDLFDLKYLDPLVGQWTEEWDSTEALGKLDRLPWQIKISLVLNGGGRVSEEASQSTVTFDTKVSLPISGPLTFALQ
jgi:general secretion pathway protein J